MSILQYPAGFVAGLEVVTRLVEEIRVVIRNGLADHGVVDGGQDTGRLTVAYDIFAKPSHDRPDRPVIGRLVLAGGDIVVITGRDCPQTDEIIRDLGDWFAMERVRVTVDP